MDILSKSGFSYKNKFILYANTYIKYKTREAIHYYYGLSSSIMKCQHFHIIAINKKDKIYINELVLEIKSRILYYGKYVGNGICFALISLEKCVQIILVFVYFDT